MKLTTLITGCTSGIGLHLAREFARHQHDLVLVAPDSEELSSLAAGLSSEFGVRCSSIPVDLESKDATGVILNSLNRDGLEIGILVNNAGHGFYGPFQDTAIEKDRSIVELNIMAVLSLTKALLPSLVSRGQGKILNTASIAGFEPGPLMAVYHATKAFVLSWSEALSVELKDSNITVKPSAPVRRTPISSRRRGWRASSPSRKATSWPHRMSHGTVTRA